MPPIRPPGTGRKARAKRRREQNKSDALLLHAPWLHGNTRPGRLAKLDMACQYLELPMFAYGPKNSGEAWPWGQQLFSGIAVDIGIGDDPCTTLELAACLAKAKDDETFGCSRLIGTDLDDNRLKYARSLVCNNDTPRGDHVLIDFCQAKGFDLSALVQKNEPLLLIRAMNVLRDYHIHDSSKALYQLHDQLSMGGVLVEGSCSPSGHLLVVIVICKQQSQDENEALAIHAVIFAAKLDEMDESDTSSPAVWFQRHLPRIWRQSCRHDDEGSNSVHSNAETMPWASKVCEFLYDWDTSYSQSVLNVDTPNTKPRQRFLESVTVMMDQRRNGTLGEKGSIRDIIMDDWIEDGVLVWKPSKEFPLTVPCPEQTLKRHAHGQKRHRDNV
jgi:hypothetical protein